jgi:N4-gp56 family major capsid protein
MALTTFGDISPRVAAYAAKDLLERGIPYLVFEKFGQTKPIPSKNSKVQLFRRYESLSSSPTELAEGVQPNPTTMTKTDVTATLKQYGALISISDVVQDTHQDPVLKEATDILGEQAAQMIEKSRLAVLLAGTNVYYTTDDATPVRTEVVDVLSLAVQRRCTRVLKRNNGKHFTSIVRSTAAYGTENCAPAFVGVIHPDVEVAVRSMNGFVPAEKYGTISPWENELGKVEDVRYVTSTIMTAWPDAGGAAGTNVSTSGTKADVYPVLYFARDAYAIVPLKGANAITPMVLNPGVPRHGDALGQVGSVGWKAMTTCVILNDAWMCRAECTVTA